MTRSIDRCNISLIQKKKRCQAATWTVINVKVSFPEYYVFYFKVVYVFLRNIQYISKHVYSVAFHRVFLFWQAGVCILNAWYFKSLFSCSGRFPAFVDYKIISILCAQEATTGPYAEAVQNRYQLSTKKVTLPQIRNCQCQYGVVFSFRTWVNVHFCS
jgi:hypothetical protein